MFFFISAWEQLIENCSWRGLRGFLSAVGIFLALAGAVLGFAFFTLCAAILSSRSFHFKYDLTWKNYGESLADTMVVISGGMLFVLFLAIVVQPIYLHWVEAWRQTSSRARAIRLMQ